MKKFYFMLLAAATIGTVQAQTQLRTKGSNETIVPASLTEQHSQTTTVLPTSQYYNDIIIGNTPVLSERRVRLAVAFNGWLYAAYNTIDTASGNGGITLRMSHDNGQNWTTMDSYSVAGVEYPVLDIVVAGTDTNNLIVYNWAVNYNTGSNTSILFVDKYDGRTGNFVGTNYNISTGTRPIYDLAVATDYRAPSINSTPYSVGLLYSVYGSPYDSVVFLCSVDGGTTWGVHESVAVTGNFFRKVSLSYGRSLSGSNGRYFAAWEMIGSTSARTGHIYTSRNSSSPITSWITPVCLDSVSSTMINLCANPQIATQFNNVDNDSAAVTAVVLVQRDYNGDGLDYDLLGFYNKRAHFTNYWNRLDIDNSGNNSMQPDVTYDPANDNFLATYYDSTLAKLPYVINGMNLVAPSTWTVISAQYNDQSNIKAPYPRVEINPAVNQAAHVWNAEGAYGVAMFDAEYLTTGVATYQHGGISMNAYPNPAQDAVTIAYELNNDASVVLEVYTMSGQLVSSRSIAKAVAGTNNESFDVSSWSNGVYFVRITNGQNVITKNIVVAH